MQQPVTVHPTAVVLPGVELAPGVEIGPFAFLEPGVEVGPGCRIGPHVHLLGRTILGPGCVVRSGSVLGGEPQDRGYAGERTEVRIGADCSIHENVTIHRATGEGATVVGDGVMLMTGCHVGHNAVLEDGVVMVNCAAVAGHARVGAGAFLSAYSAVHQHTRVGRLTLLGGATMVIRDAPPFSLIVGSYPARWRGPNTVGLRRAGLSSEVRSALRRALHRLFHAPEGPRAVAETLAEDPVAEVRELAAFVLAARRGLVAGPERAAKLGPAES